MKPGIISTASLLLCLAALTSHAQAPNQGVMKNRFGEGASDKPAAAGRDRENGSLFGNGLMAKIVTSDAFAEKLGLTEKQVKELKDGFLDLRKKEIQLKADLEIAGEEQARLMTDEEADEGDIIKAVEKAGKIKTEMAVVKVRQLMLVKKVLNPEQRKLMRQMLRSQMKQAVDAKSGCDGQYQQENGTRGQHKGWLKGRSGRDGKNRWGNNDSPNPVQGGAGRDSDDDDDDDKASSGGDTVTPAVETGAGRGSAK